MILTHLDKLYWKKEKITKKDLIDYYKKIAKTLLPYLKGRPLVMRRFPSGVQKEGFFQKEAGENLPPFVKTLSIQHENRTISYITVENIKTLLYVINLGSIELHPLSTKGEKLDFPSFLILDLDPMDISFDQVVEVARECKAALHAFNIESFCKTTGGKGLHIYVPLKEKYPYKVIQSFAKKIALRVHEKFPDITTLDRAIQKRKKKIYLDCGRNGKGQTAVAPYSVRARPNATVSTPLSWSEVKKGLDPNDFTIKTVCKRIEEKGDLFKKILSKGAKIPYIPKLLQ